MGRLGRIALALLVVVLGLACDSDVDRRLAIELEDIGTYFPGRQVDCSAAVRCHDLLAEVAAWVELHAGSLGPAHIVTLHAPATADGPAVITRSGGSTWVAVVTFEDGSRVAMIVGCGVGIAPEICFSDDGKGHAHNSAED